MNTAYKYLTTNSEENKEVMNLKTWQGGVYGKDWKEEKEGRKRCNCIMTSKKCGEGTYRAKKEIVGEIVQ